MEAKLQPESVHDAERVSDRVTRFAVPGGWVYYVWTSSRSSCCCFVPAPVDQVPYLDEHERDAVRSARRSLSDLESTAPGDSYLAQALRAIRSKLTDI